MDNKLSVYIVTYNRSDYIGTAIQGVLNQTYKDFKLFVLDNASTDDTAQVVAKFADPRLHYIRHEKNIGGIGNINYAFDHCESDYFVVFHDDDQMHVDMLEKEIQYMELHPEAALVSGLCNQIDANGRFTRKAHGNSGIVESFRGTDMFYEYLRNQKNLVFPSIMYRDDFIKRNNIRMNPNVGPCSDIVLYFEVARYGGVLSEIQEPLIDYRVHVQQDSSKNFGIMLKRLFEFLRADNYYSALLVENEKEQYDYFRWFMSKIIIRVASGAIDIATANNECEDFKKLLLYRKADYVFCKLILWAESRFPRVFSWGYRLLKGIRNSRSGI